VSIQFDDGASSVYETVYPLMAARGMKGTAYIESSLIGTTGHMSAAQLLELNAAGWDIGNHTVDHPDLRTLSVAQQQAELTGCQTALDSLGLTRASRHVAYPSGWYNADTLTAMANAGMLTGRISGGNTIDPPPVPIYELDSPNPWTLDVGKEFVQDALLTNGTFLFHQHDIGTAPDFSVVDFTAWLDYLVAQNVRTVTVSELYDRIK